MLIERRGRLGIHGRGFLMADVPTSGPVGISIDWCTADRIPVLQSLIENHWRKGHILARDRVLLRWQYRHPSDPEKLSVLLAEDNGEPVGMLGLIHSDFCVKGARVPGAWLAMWLTVPEWRARMLGLRLLRQLFARGYGMVGTLGVNQETTGSIYRALGFTACDVVPRWVASRRRRLWRAWSRIARHAIHRWRGQGGLRLRTAAALRLEVRRAIGRLESGDGRQMGSSLARAVCPAAGRHVAGRGLSAMAVCRPSALSVSGAFRRGSVRRS